MRMWAWVFRTDQAVIDATQVEGFMYGNPKAARALVSFGFLEPKEDGTYRVRGSSRLLGWRDAKRKGGHAAKKNLIPGAAHRKKPAHGPADALADGLPMTQPMNSMGRAWALTPTTHYQQPIETLRADAQSAPPLPKKPKRERDKPAPDPRHTPLRDALLEAYEAATGAPYLFQGGRDGKAISLLLAHRGFEQEACVGRWREALGRQGFERPRDILDFASKWNLYAQGPPKRNEALLVGAHAAAQACVDCGEVALGGTDWGDWVCYPCTGRRRVKQARREVHAS